MGQDVAERWAQLKDDVIRFSGHVLTVARWNFPGPQNPDVVGRVRYRAGGDGPVVWIDRRLRPEDRLRVLEAAWQVMLTGVPEAERVTERGGYWHVDISWEG